MIQTSIRKRIPAEERFWKFVEKTAKRYCRECKRIRQRKHK